MTDSTKNLIIRMFHVSKSYGAKKALIDINLDIYKNDFVLLLCNIKTKHYGRHR